MSSDDRLAARAASGDRRAFERIYERYHQELYRFCLALVRNPQDAQDALQNTMVKVLRALPGETREIKLKPWLYRVARNESVEVLRKRHPNEELSPEQGAAIDVAETAAVRERLATLLADVGQLPERQRAVLVMRELSGLDFDQIAASLGSTPAVARQTLYEARLGLRQREAGREMRCAEVMRIVSDADGRVTRRRDVQAHLRSCTECRAFRDGIDKRQQDLAALGPLPLAASSGVLAGVLGGGTGGSAAGGGLAGSGAVAGKAVATSTLAKSAATVAVAGVLGVSVADRSGVIDVPLPGQDDSKPAKTSPAGDGQETGSAAAVDTSAPSGNGGDKAVAEARSGAVSGGVGAGRASAKVVGSESSPTEASANPNVAGPSASSRSLSPPGGGHGRSASEHRGRPEQLPAAAAHGQSTAATHKATHAQGPKRGTPSRGRGGAKAGATGPPAQPPGKSQAKSTPPPHPDQSQVEDPAQGKAVGEGSPPGHDTPPGQGP